MRVGQSRENKVKEKLYSTAQSGFDAELQIFVLFFLLKRH